MSLIRSGLVAMVALGGLIVGTADGTQAATPTGKHNANGRAPSSNAGGYGYGSGSKAHRKKCPPSGPYHGAATVKATAASVRARGYCPPGGGSPEFSLTVMNNSTQFQDIVVYQKPLDLGVPNALPVAWLRAPSFPGTTVTFHWKQDYSFVWSQTSQLRPGVTVKAEQTVPADPQNETTNHTQFDFRNGTFTLAPDADPGRLGSLTIREQASVPPNTAAVGIGMSGEPTFAVQAQPNINLVFSPHPDYWVTAGTYTQGEVLDIEQITNEANLPFVGTFAMNAVLDSTGNWTVTPRRAARHHSAALHAPATPGNVMTIRPASPRARR